MSGSIKMFGIIIFGSIVLFLLTNLAKRIVVEDDLFESTRTTQYSVIQEEMNLGDLFVNNNYSINKESVIKEWVEHFNENRNSKLHYKVDIVDIHESPPAIAVRVRGYTSILMSEEKLELDYTNIIVLDERGEIYGK